MKGKKIGVAIGAICLLLLLYPKKQQPIIVKEYIVQKEHLEKRLFFAGTIQPLHITSLISPIDATVQSIEKYYGQWVEKGHAIAFLYSQALQKQFNEVFTEYLKVKESYFLAKSKFQGTQDLWKAGLIAKNVYLGEKSSLASTHITYLQASHKLKETLEKMDGPAITQFSALTIEDFNEIKQALTENHPSITVKAPVSGVLLYPPVLGNEKKEPLSIGSLIKEGEIIALIGDITGIRVEIEIPEVDIAGLAIGMPVVVKGLNGAHAVFSGTLASIQAQAVNASAALPLFRAEVRVPALQEAEKAWVRIGMSASVEVIIPTKAMIYIPITAVLERNGKHVVKRKLSNGKIIYQPIITGMVMQEKVAVISGLQVGDILLYG
jgi:multidrug efflux pump subunit AcrA (membrane-fusion protein)